MGGVRGTGLRGHSLPGTWSDGMLGRHSVDSSLTVPSHVRGPEGLLKKMKTQYRSRNTVISVFYVCECFVDLYTCVPYSCLIPKDIRREHHIKFPGNFLWPGLSSVREQEHYNWLRVPLALDSGSSHCPGLHSQLMKQPREEGSGQESSVEPSVEL